MDDEDSEYVCCMNNTIQEVHYIVYEGCALTKDYINQDDHIIIRQLKNVWTDH